MFSCLVAGRLPLTAPTQVDETHAVFYVEDAQSVNHVAVFMTGVAPFPEGYAATVHFLWPGEGKQWQLLGCLKNSKPSSIFRLKNTVASSSIASSSTSSTASGLFSSTTAPSQQAAAAWGNTTAQASVTATLGISIESDEAVEAQMQALQGTQRAAPDGGASSADASFAATSTALVPASQGIDAALQLAPKIANNFFQYLYSFAPDTANQTAPMLKQWLEGFERKLKSQGLAFLDKTD